MHLGPSVSGFAVTVSHTRHLEVRNNHLANESGGEKFAAWRVSMQVQRTGVNLARQGPI